MDLGTSRAPPAGSIYQDLSQVAQLKHLSTDLHCPILHYYHQLIIVKFYPPTTLVNPFLTTLRPETTSSKSVHQKGSWR